jgi:hypothetical protein
MTNLHDLADKIGYEAIDEEIMVWLDNDVYLRREAMSVIKQHEPDLVLNLNDVQREALRAGDGYRQACHRLQHPDGPYGWEFCGVCK